MTRIALPSPSSSVLLPSVLLLAACHQQELLKNLTEEQANEIVAVLQAHNVSVRKADLGKAVYGVTVEQADFPAAVDLLRQFKLPSPTRIDIAQSFPTDMLVASPQAEQARLLSAIEQRLEQSLAALQNVTSARVQVSYPLKAMEIGKSDPPMHASVLIAYRNEINPNVLISEVKRFVKNSFANIDYEDISVIVERVPTTFRDIPSSPSASSPATWQYWLLGIPVAIAGVAMGALASRPWRRNIGPNTARAQPESASTPRHTDATSDSGIRTTQANEVGHTGPINNAATTRTEPTIAPDRGLA